MNFRKGVFLASLVVSAILCGIVAEAQTGKRLQFVVSVAAGLLTKPESGRLYVSLGRVGGRQPRLEMAQTGLDGPPTLAIDVSAFQTGSSATLDERAYLYPLSSLRQLKAGKYAVQAVFDFNRDLKSPNAPGNLYSEVQTVQVDPASGGIVRLTLTKANPPDTLPPDTEQVKYIKLRSEKLSAFWKRPIYLRAGVILPRDYAKEPMRRYPLWVKIGGYGSRYTNVGFMMRSGSGFQNVWMADKTPRMILLHLDGAGPLGDPYQVNSANHGPYGDAITQELIPYIEQKFRGIGRPFARVLDGGSTGGWVSFALQVFYPDFFNGCWSYSPDPVDFRAYQLVDIYRDKNAYINQDGFERPGARKRNGDVSYTMRNECYSENLVSRNSSYVFSGGQWGAWNATFSPRLPNGDPAPLWNPQTGEIDPKVAQEWKKYDLRIHLETNWKTLAPRLRGKIHLWVGEADEYFLNNAVHLLDAFFQKADPPFVGTLKFGPGQGHVWTDLNTAQIMDQMMEQIQANGPK